MAREGKPRRKLTRAESARRNGARGGRPRERPGPAGIAWSTVRRYARLGVSRDLIVRGMGIPAEVMRDPSVLQRFQEELDRGEALYQIDLLEDVRRLGRGRHGKVNAVLASLRQAAGWGTDRPKGSEAQRPDQAAAVAEIQRMLGRFRAPR